jgi:hypothetical protein
MSLEETLTSVWRQALIEGCQEVTLQERASPVRCTPKRHLRQVDFYIDNKVLRGEGHKGRFIPRNLMGTMGTKCEA